MSGARTVQIRDARVEEYRELTEFCCRSKAFWGYDAAFLDQCRDALAITTLKSEGWYVRVAESREGMPVGVLAISFEETKHGTHAEVERLFVDPAAIRTGVGRALMDDGLKYAASRGAESLWILSDPGAEAFYLSMGAVRIGLRPSDAIGGRTLPWLRLFLGGTPSRLHTERLILRPWLSDDKAPFSAMNADPRVMRHLPHVLTRAESDALADQMRIDFQRYGFGRWAVQRIDDPVRPFIGFIGLAVAAFDAPFTPCVEIGWRLAAEHWGIGLATEGARAAVRYGFDHLGLDEIVSFTVPENLASRRVMEKIGMRRSPLDDFEHPRLPLGHRLRRHVLYRLRPNSKVVKVDSERR